MVRFEDDLSGPVGAIFPPQALRADPVASGAETRQACGGLISLSSHHC